MSLFSLRAFTVAAALAFSGVTAHAQAQNSACKADAQKLCKDAKPGGGRVLACLKQHESELSAPCKEQLPKMAACAEEVKKVCGHVGQRKMRECVKTNAEQLKASCQGQNAAEH